jgi:hypothetical protein
MVPPNAAPEWQAGSFWLRSRELVVACPLEGLVRRVETSQTNKPVGLASLHTVLIRLLPVLCFRAYLHGNNLDHTEHGK